MRWFYLPVVCRVSFINLQAGHFAILPSMGDSGYRFNCQYGCQHATKFSAFNVQLIQLMSTIKNLKDKSSFQVVSLNFFNFFTFSVGSSHKMTPIDTMPSQLTKSSCRLVESIDFYGGKSVGNTEVSIGFLASLQYTDVLFANSKPLNQTQKEFKFLQPKEKTCPRRLGSFKIKTEAVTHSPFGNTPIQLSESCSKTGPSATVHGPRTSVQLVDNLPGLSLAFKKQASKFHKLAATRNGWIWRPNLAQSGRSVRSVTL